MASALPILTVVPLIGSWIMTFLFGNVKSRKYSKSWYQPPGWVFFVVWTLLYVMLGFLLYESSVQEDYLLLGFIIALTSLTYLWIFFFNYLRNDKLAIWTILLILAFSLVVFSLLIDSKIVENTSFGIGYLAVFSPFIAWIIFALLLSINTKLII